MRLRAITFSVGRKTICLVPAFFHGRGIVRRGIWLDVPLVLLCIKPHRFFLFFVCGFFETFGFLTTSWWLINTCWVTLVRVYDVERPKTPNELEKNITDDVARGTWRCILWNVSKLFVSIVFSSINHRPKIIIINYF